MTKAKADHVVCRDNAFYCQHCGDVWPLSLPCSLGMFAAMARQYVKEHRRCAKPGDRRRVTVRKLAAEITVGLAKEKPR